MGDPKENPDPGPAGSGVESTQSTFAAEYTAWQRWALNARLDRLSARQRRAVALVAAGLAATPERALEARGGRA